MTEVSESTRAVLAGACAGILLAACGCGSQATGSGSPSPTVGFGSPAPHVTQAYRVVLEPDGTLLVPDGHAMQILRVDARGGSISIVAGDGGQGLKGVGGPARLSSIGLPRDVAVAPDGTIYIASATDRILRVDAGTSVLTVLAGSGQKGSGGDGGSPLAATLDSPTGVAVDRSNNVLVTEAGGTVRKVDVARSIITTVAGTGVSGFSGDGGRATQAQLNGPHGLAVGPDGSIYIADTQNNRVRRIGGDGTISSVAAGDLNLPSGVTATAAGDLLIADFGNNRIRRVAAGGAVDTLVDTVTGPTGVVQASDGTIYVSQLDSGLLRIDTSGRRTMIGA